MIVIATQIQIKSIPAFFRFIPMVRNIRRQLAGTEGLVFVKFNGLRTFTGWENYEVMKVFRNSGNHLDAMQNLKSIGKSKSVAWEAESEPGWHEAREKLDGVQY